MQESKPQTAAATSAGTKAEATEMAADPLELLPPTAFDVDCPLNQLNLKSAEESKDSVTIDNQSAEFVKEFARLVVQDEILYKHMKSAHEDFLQGALLLAQKYALSEK